MGFLLIPVVLCGAYLVMVAVCVCERMTPQTNHFTRALVVAIGGVGFWALCKAIVFGWGSTPGEFAQGVAIVAIAAAIGSSPRINTGYEKSRSSHSGKIRQGR